MFIENQVEHALASVAAAEIMKKLFPDFDPFNFDGIKLPCCLVNFGKLTAILINIGKFNERIFKYSTFLQKNSFSNSNCFYI